MRRLAIGLLHPGEMGAAVGGALAGAVHTVRWASEGRGPQTAERARQAGLKPTPVRSRNWPGEVTSSPRSARRTRRWRWPGRSPRPAFRGVFADANAISPATARTIAAIIEAAGGSYADGGIIGPPPAEPGSTRLYLSGPCAAEIRDLFDGTSLEAATVQWRRCCSRRTG